MMHFGFYIAIFVLGLKYTPCGAVTLECPYLPHIEKLDNNLKQELNNSIFWNRIYTSSYKEFDLAFTGFSWGSNIVRTYLKFEGDLLVSQSYVSSQTTSHINLFEFKYQVDDKQAIFENIQTKTGALKRVNGIILLVPLSNIPIIGKRFALVYRGGNGAIRVFQSCDGDFVWIQVSDEIWQSTSYSENFNDEVITAANNLGLNLEILNVIGNDTFPFHFDFTHFDDQSSFINK